MTFPGRIYDPEGVSLSPDVPDLTQDVIDAYPHRSMVSGVDFDPDDDGDLNPSVVGQVWVLSDDAEYEAVPLAVRVDALALMAAGKGILLVARHPDPGIAVRDGLLDAMEQFEADPAGTA